MYCEPQPVHSVTSNSLVLPLYNCAVFCTSYRHETIAKLFYLRPDGLVHGNSVYLGRLYFQA